MNEEYTGASTSEANPQRPKKNTLYIIRLPLIVAVTLVVGMLLGATMFGTTVTSPSGKTQADLRTTLEKLKQIMLYIEHYYVDDVDVDSIAEHGITQMLQKLDPHTSYIPIKDLQIMNAQLEGDFEGVGIEFNIANDTLNVNATIPGGPSETAGLQPGDKIVEVDGKGIAGTGLTTRDVFDLLRGPKDSKVKLGIVRKGQPGIKNYTIIRDKIPTHTVDVSYMIDDKTGYIKVSRFGENTYNEFKDGLKKLKDDGMKQLVLDLRGNPGGYMDRAVNMVDEMLDGKKKIVYTDGKGETFDDELYASRKGDFEDGPIIVLINEGSASASEIVSGALQDNDRALIVGRRSFGKGLVQKPFSLADGSQLRLTISRYYTPSGRCIQKSYDNYESDLVERYRQGEFFHADSIKFDESQKHKTLQGRTVYGGGGIMPDIFIPRDTSHFSNYLDSVFFNPTLVRDFVIDYVNGNRKSLQKMGVDKYVKDFKIEGKVEDAFLSKAKSMGVTFDAEGYKTSGAFIRNQLKARIARLMWQDEGFYRVSHKEDEELQKALEFFGKAKDIARGKFND